MTASLNSSATGGTTTRFAIALKVSTRGPGGSVPSRPLERLDRVGPNCAFRARKNPRGAGFSGPCRRYRKCKGPSEPWPLKPLLSLGICMTPRPKCSNPEVGWIARSCGLDRQRYQLIPSLSPGKWGLHCEALQHPKCRTTTRARLQASPRMVTLRPYCPRLGRLWREGTGGISSNVITTASAPIANHSASVATTLQSRSHCGNRFPKSQLTGFIGGRTRLMPGLVLGRPSTTVAGARNIFRG